MIDDSICGRGRRLNSAWRFQGSQLDFVGSQLASRLVWHGNRCQAAIHMGAERGHHNNAEHRNGK